MVSVGPELLKPEFFEAFIGDGLINQLLGGCKSVQKLFGNNHEWIEKSTKQIARFAKLFGEDV